MKAGNADILGIRKALLFMTSECNVKKKKKTQTPIEQGWMLGFRGLAISVPKGNVGRREPPGECRIGEC